jgi:hypothetical protein
MGALISGPVGAFCFGMAILGGYWPIVIVYAPLLVINPSALWGVVLGLPQIIPFLWYFPRSIRAKKKVDPSWGRMPIKRFFVRLRWPENGMIHYAEYSFGVGICGILTLFYPSPWWFFALLGFIGSQGLLPIDRIPARWVYLVSTALVFGALPLITATFEGWGAILPLLVLQMFLLWQNRDIYPSFPFSQWWRKEHVFKGSNWPNNTGYMTGEHHHDYFGGFSLASNYHE